MIEKVGQKEVVCHNNIVLIARVELHSLSLPSTKRGLNYYFAHQYIFFAPNNFCSTLPIFYLSRIICHRVSTSDALVV